MTSKTSFANLYINDSLLEVLSELGYEKPTPVQKESIPILLDGKDLLAQAQTGTGKTAAFALPILTQIDVKHVYPQAIVLAPTRELAIQVAESFQHYAKNIKGFHVLPIYGGQDYNRQLKALKRGVHVVVGTPGRVMDHLRRETLRLDGIRTVILDEADKMLEMGFQEDVEWILSHIKTEHQTALFSATIPAAIRKVANKYLQDAREIKIKAKEATVDTIEQSYLLVEHHNKLEALTRFLEIEQFEAILIFTRTKASTEELAEKLEARGYTAAAMNGDMKQAIREKTIARLKGKSLDIIVATEVAARGLDIERISHVINYDIPFDAEAYVHQIGRTGRAGRQGKSLLFVTPREIRMLRDIEYLTQKKITPIAPPSINEINQKRADAFIKKVLTTIATKDLQASHALIEQIAHDSEHDERDIAAALAYMAQKNKPLKEIQTDPLIMPSVAELEEKRRVARKKRRSGGSGSRARSKAKAAHSRSGFKNRKRSSPNKNKK